MVLPLALLLVAVGVVAHLVVSGLAVSFEQVTPKLSRVSPVSGFKKIFSISNLFEFLKTLLKVLAIGLVTVIVFLEMLNAWIRIPWCGVSCVLPLLESSVARVTVGFAIILVFIAGVDVLVQRRLYLRQQRMTMEELRREQKESTGDPQVRGRRRQLQQDCLLYTSPSPRDATLSRMPSSA